MPARTKGNTTSGKKGSGSAQPLPAAPRVPDVSTPSAHPPKSAGAVKRDVARDDEAVRTPSTTPAIPPPQTAAEISNYLEAYLRLKEQEQQTMDALRPAFVAQVTRTPFPPVTGVRRGEKGGMLFDNDPSADAVVAAALRTAKKRPRTDATGTGSTMEVLGNTSDDEVDGEGSDAGGSANTWPLAGSGAGSTPTRARAFADALNEANGARMEEILEMLQHSDLAPKPGTRAEARGSAAAGDDDTSPITHWEQLRNLVTDVQRKAMRQQAQQQKSSGAAADGDASSRSPPPIPSDEDVAMAMFTEISRISQGQRSLGGAMAAYKSLAGEMSAAGVDGDVEGCGHTEREVQSAMAESMRAFLGLRDYGALVGGGVDGRAFTAGAGGLGATSHDLAYDEDNDDFTHLQLAIEDQKNRTHALQDLQPETLKALVDNSRSLSFPSNTAVFLETMPTTDDPNRSTVAQRLSESTAVAAAMLLQLLESRLTENVLELTLLSQGKEETHKYLTRLHRCLHHELHTLPDDRLLDIARCLGQLGEADTNPDPNALDPDAIFNALSAVGTILFFVPMPLPLLETVCAELGIGTSDEASMDRLVLTETLAEKIACHIHHVKLSLAQLPFVPKLQVHEHAPGSYTCTVDHASCLGLLPKERLLSNRFSCSRIRLRAVLSTSQEACGALSLHVWHRHATNLTTHMLIRTSEPKKKKKKGGNTPAPAASAAAPAGEEDDDTRTPSALFIEQEGVAVPGQCFGFDDFVSLDRALDSPTTLQYGLRTYNRTDDRLVFQLSISLENMDGTALPTTQRQQATGQANFNQSFDSVPASNATGTTNHIKGGSAGGRGGGGGVIDRESLLRQAQKQATDDLEQAESAERSKLEAEARTSFSHLQNDECRGVRAAKQKMRERLFKAEMAKVSAPPELVRESEKLTQSVQNTRQQVQKLEKEKAKEEKDVAKTTTKLTEAMEELERLTAKLQADRATLAQLEKDVKTIQARNEAKQQRVREHNERKKARQQLSAQLKRAAAVAQQQMQQRAAKSQPPASVAPVTPPSSTQSPAKSLAHVGATPRTPGIGESSPAAPARSTSAAAVASANTAAPGVGGESGRPINSLFIDDLGTFLSQTHTMHDDGAGQGSPGLVGASASLSGVSTSNPAGATAPALGRLFSTSPSTRVQQEQQRRSVPDSSVNGYAPSGGMADLGLNGRAVTAGLPPFGTTTPTSGANVGGGATTSGFPNSSPASPGGMSTSGGFRASTLSGSRSPHTAATGSEEAMGGLSPAVGTPASNTGTSASAAAGVFGVPSRLGTSSLFTSSTSPFIFSTGAGGPGAAPGASSALFMPGGAAGPSSQMHAHSGPNTPAAALIGGGSGAPSPLQSQPSSSTPLFSTKAPAGSGASSTVGNHPANDLIGYGAAPGPTSPSPVPASSGMFQSFQVMGAPAGDLGMPGAGNGGGFGLSAFTTNPAGRTMYGGSHLDADSHAFHPSMDLGGGGTDLGAHPNLFTVSAGSGAGHAGHSGSPLYGAPGLGFPGDGLTSSQPNTRQATSGTMNLNHLLFHTSPLQGGAGAVGSNTPPPVQGPQSPMGGLFDPTNGLPYQW